ncbi:hypothetical protein LCM20_13835 [Halobacillus litoralis]|uniref:hypothetical protein n=1 Tax=Halobacillus litoralis TaxID=45668 RepID=UPI001CD6994D|nr:hypothetical protein [Halobacillus litoralis]MCA0971682.1 hypothetical protein [Halobacillus litoralis]
MNSDLIKLKQQEMKSTIYRYRQTEKKVRSRSSLFTRQPAFQPFLQDKQKEVCCCC